jgi:hypothetical protein
MEWLLLLKTGNDSGKHEAMKTAGTLEENTGQGRHAPLPPPVKPLFGRIDFTIKNRLRRGSRLA